MKVPPDIKAADLQRIGISKPYSHQLISGARMPSLPLALRIKAELGVAVECWSHNGAASSSSDDAVVAPGADHGAEKSLAVFSPAGGAA